jgi:sodium-dependent multivitamin transporter 6
MNSLDWGIIAIYLTGIVAMAVFVGRRQESLSEYYLAGGKTRWWQSGLSTMATQLGAISFVSAPAFVAAAEGGGLKWLCYELGVPLGILIVIALILPTMHRKRYVSIYEYLEYRFDRGARVLISWFFQIGRALATAVSVFAGGLIISTALGISTWAAVLVVGGVTLVYAVIGGIRTVILSDVLQMGIIVAGIAICGGAALYLSGWSEGWSALSPARLQILDFAHFGLTSEGEYSFWPMLVGGIFLYASYYGCDQSQMQRELSVGSLDGARKSMLVNALGRFPLVLLYCLMGVFVGAVLMSPSGLGRAAAALGVDSSEILSTLGSSPDRMLPMFILTFLPNGVIGFIFVAIMSALMSSLDSAINSLSAVTVRDFYQLYIKPEAEEQHYLLMSKIFTALWGIFCIAAALVFLNFGEGAQKTTIVLINAVGSLLYGPILAAFLLGLTTKWAAARAVKLGVLAGVAANLAAWLLTDISWLWWNALGFVATFAAAALLSFSGKAKKSEVSLKLERAVSRKSLWVDCAIVSVYLVFIILFCCWMQHALSNRAEQPGAAFL